MKKWFTMTEEEVLKELHTNPDRGLEEEEIKRRLDKYGQNKLQESKGRGLSQMFIDQFKDVLIIILLVYSALISGFLGEISDVVVIGIILILNATLGVILEYKAEKSLAALKEMVAPEAVVIRDGEHKKIPAADLVPGDIVLNEFFKFSSIIYFFQNN